MHFAIGANAVMFEHAAFKNTESLSSRKFARPTRGGRRSVSKRQAKNRR